ncbi:hypothetical protein PSAB6_440018 [Paraburkholderia sabiae]|nr:hypothetical protein PSAB6_440018 [Paraburkholderia sabiae]
MGKTLIESARSQTYSLAISKNQTRQKLLGKVRGVCDAQGVRHERARLCRRLSGLRFSMDCQLPVLQQELAHAFVRRVQAVVAHAGKQRLRKQPHRRHT